MQNLLSLQPDAKDSRVVELRHPDVSAPIRLMMWERIYYLNWAQNGWRSLNGEPSPFQPIGNGGLRRELRSRDGLHAEIILETLGETLAVTISATNITREIGDVFWGAFDIHDLWLDLCVHFRNAKEFYDPDFARVFVSVNKTLIPLRETSLTGYQKAITSYWPRGQSRRHSQLPEGHCNYGTGISATEADDTWLGVESRDGQFALVASYPRVHNLWANRREPVHGCIHANPLLGDVKIDETKRMTGAVVLARGSLVDARARAKEMMK